jgi:transposase-like protein
MKYTIKTFKARFPDDAACLAHIYRRRWPNGATCSSCKHEDCFYPLTGRKAYVCSWCGHQISPTAGTIFDHSPTPLTSWFHAMFLFATAKNGVAAMEIMRQIGITYKCAWRIAHKIRTLMAQDSTILGGMLEADETYVGGVHHGGKRGVGAEGKTPVFGVVERGGKIRAKVIKHARSAVVMPLLLAMAAKGSMLSTDESNIYNKVESAGFIHESVRHSANQYVKGAVHTQTIDGFWSQFKRSLNGTYHSVSPKYLQTYLDEFCFRYDHRDDSENVAETLFAMVGEVK